MSTGSYRRENLKFLIACHGTQSAFANALRHKTLTQPILSSIVRSKRMFHTGEVRDVEQFLCIPEGWMDRYPLRKTWLELQKLRNMDADAVRTVHALIKFAAQT